MAGLLRERLLNSLDVQLNPQTSIIYGPRGICATLLKARIDEETAGLPLRDLLTLELAGETVTWIEQMLVLRVGVPPTKAELDDLSTTEARPKMREHEEMDAWLELYNRDKQRIFVSSLEWVFNVLRAEVKNDGWQLSIVWLTIHHMKEQYIMGLVFLDPNLADEFVVSLHKLMVLLKRVQRR